MQNTYGKLFRHATEEEVQCFSYDPQEDYYSMVNKLVDKGYQQCIFTSPIMISCIEHFLFHHSAQLLDIEFLVKDDSLKEEVHALIEKMSYNGIYWSKLKSKLEFLSNDESVDIKRVQIRCNEDMGYLLTFQVNGVVYTDSNHYESTSNEIVEIVRRVIH